MMKGKKIKKINLKKTYKKLKKTYKRICDLLKDIKKLSQLVFN